MGVPIWWNQTPPFSHFSAVQRRYPVAVVSGREGLLAPAQVAAGQQAAGVLELAVKRTSVLLLEFIRRPEWLRAL
jgi:hypothetical protein